MIALKRTTSEDLDFIQLIAALDADLSRRDGKEHAFYDQFNSIEGLRHALVAYSDSKPIGCGALKPYDSSCMEIKRMYVIPASRGKRTASQILTELENWAVELQYKSCILETGKRQLEAINMYKKNEYVITSNYGQYHGVANSICFKKEVSFKKL